MNSLQALLICRLANKYFVLASTTMLVYDHLLTLERERLYIWKQRKTLPAYLFFLFRYSTPIISLINLVAEHAPWWTGPICTRWIWLPVASGVIVSCSTGIILILRVHAIYARAKWVLCVAVPIYLTQMAIMIYSVPAGVAAQLPPGFVGCVPSEKLGTGHRLSYIYISALAFDAMIFALTLCRVISMRLNNTNIPILVIIFRDGTLYFTVLFFVNLVNVILLSLAPPDLNAINAPFATMITSLLVARLVLNLRESGHNMIVDSQNQPSRLTFRHSLDTLHATTSGLSISSDPTLTVNSHDASAKDEGGQVRYGNITFFNMFGLDEFDAPLGDINPPYGSRAAFRRADVQIEMENRVHV